MTGFCANGAAVSDEVAQVVGQFRWRWLRRDNRFQRLFKLRNITLKNIPDDAEINVGVIMNQTMPQSRPALRVYFRMHTTETVRKIVCILTDQLDVVNELLGDWVPLVQGFPRHSRQKFPNAPYRPFSRTLPVFNPDDRREPVSPQCTVKR